MKIYLFDKNYTEDEPSTWSIALDARFATVTKYGPPESCEAYADRDAILFVHTDYQSEWEKRAERECTLCHFVFVRSDLRVPSLSNEKGNIHGCYWTATEFGSTDHPEINRFVARISEESSSEPVDWTLLESPKFGERLALRLLAEAWLDKNNPLIRQPNNGDWFSSFGLNMNDDAATLIATDVGTGSTEAEALLKAVVLDNLEKDLVENFLKASARPAVESR
jgi:hypothetical protein